MSSFPVFSVSLSRARAGPAVGTPGPTQVVPKWTWKDLTPEGGMARLRGLRSILSTEANLLCFRYLLGCLRLDAASTSSASQFLLCPISRVGIYPSPVHATVTEPPFGVRQPFLVPVFLNCHCYFLTREEVEPSAQSPLGLPGASAVHWARTPQSKCQLSCHCAWRSPGCSICVGGTPLTCPGSRGTPPSHSSYRNQGSSGDTRVLSPSQAGYPGPWAPSACGCP